MVMRRAASGTKNAGGRDLSAASRPAWAIRLRAIGSSGPVPSGTMSRSTQGTEALARWAAIRAPMVPAPHLLPWLENDPRLIMRDGSGRVKERMAQEVRAGAVEFSP